MLVIHTSSRCTKTATISSNTYLFDSGVRVRDSRRSTSDGDPVLSRRILEGDSASLVVLEVVELLRVVVGKVQEVGADLVAKQRHVSIWLFTHAKALLYWDWKGLRSSIHVWIQPLILPLGQHHYGLSSTS